MTDPRLSSPAALRNRDVILAELHRYMPATGHVLEIASGTGEHITHFAPAFPGLIWQPTDPDPARRASIDARRADIGASNLRPALALDAAQPGWSAEHGPVEGIMLANLLHLITTPQANTVLDEIAAALAPGGIALIYGPFLRDGETTSEGDAAFDAQIRRDMPGCGYKDVITVTAQLVAGGLRHVDTTRMPANNLLLAFERPTK